MSVNEDENALSSLSQDEKNVEKTAKNLRGRAKSSLTRISNFVNNDKQTFQKHDLCNKLEKIEMIYADFDKADAMLPLENSEMEEFEIKYYETKAKLQKRLEKLNINIHTNTQAVVNNQIPVTSTSTIANNFKLPRLNIQPFSGNYKEWMSFKDLYISLVHGNEVISNIQKFQYLKGLLIGEPASIIKHIPISENSYHEAWDKLLNRYDKKKQIVSSLIKTFMEIPSCSHTNSANLRNIADTSDEIIRGLNSIGAKANERDIWLIYILLQKVDTKTREEWAHHTVNEDFPTFEKFIQFINDKCYSLELYFESEESKQKRESFSNTTHKSVGYNITCPMCKSNHFLFKCSKYKDLSTDKRKQFVRKFKLCTNCLSEKHSDLQCNSTFRCHICKQKHHSSLHDYNFQSYSIATTNSKTGFTKGKALENDSATDKQKDSKRNTSLNTAQTSFALLPTASVYVYDSMGQKHLMRLMVDSGSESTFVTESCINSLGIKRRNARLPVRGLSKKEITVTKGVAELRLVSIYNKDIQLSINAFILNKLTDTMPSQKLNEKHFLHLKNLQLADPHFAIPNKVDIILGADYFFSILLPTQVTCAEASLIAQNSIFGFLVSGKLPDDFPNKSRSISSLHIYETNIDCELKRFWELEEISKPKDIMFTPEEQFVENHFKENFTINSDGRFVVKLPFYKSKSEIGNSKQAAISRLLAMEKKFRDNPDYERQYKDFMYEYEQLGHMEPVNERPHSEEKEQFFLPHHAVIKPSSTTTKLRVVFDASCKSSSGASLNSLLGVGPKLQRDIFEILLSFRMPEIVFSADIEKMYRQIWVADEDRNYQQILWRSHPSEDIRAFKLKTVTYGLAPASFLATRCIKQIALDYTQNPIVSQILQEDMYMDDLLSGASTVNSAISICKEITTALYSHGFHLRKWKSNSTAFLSEFSEHCSTADFEISPDGNESSKVLGLFWNPSRDAFIFKTALALAPPLTKRRILSQTARIFDPTGLISPCTVTLKIFYQKLWLTKGDWDSPIPQHLTDDLLKFQDEFNKISEISVPRCVLLASSSSFELHGFSDASTSAFAAAIYCRQSYNGKINVSLLVSKTKVAPIKQISVPKLELCAAHLLSRLFSSVMKTFKSYNFDIYAWTDSKVVLSWLSSHPRKWKTFVANRTSEIIEVLPSMHWRYVPTKDNPADIASRGIDPKRLPDCSLWWNGPSWLILDSAHWPEDELNVRELDDQIKAEQRPDPIFSFLSYNSNDIFDDLFNKHSSLLKIVRILAYCIRFITRLRNAKENKISSSNNLNALTFPEIKYAEESIIRWVQSVHFHEDMKCIKDQKTLSKKSQLHSLHPFIDEGGLLRVGGRLENAQLKFNQKHPVILPSQHKFSELLVTEKHIAHLHAGPTLLSHIIKQSYWIIGGKKIINKFVRRCVKCCRFKSSTTTSQLMGNLPEHRVTLERPFFTCGVDYCGPISIKFNKGRGTKSTKGYVALFICLATKAVHIEAVSDLTADAFIAALRRLSARRGAPRHIYSDNATNFVGARRKLSEIENLWLKLPADESIINYLAQASIEWHFIPPAAPHFGGIWEAAIRSAKYHLKRVIGETLLTFEELATLLTQIEALLNSRPLVIANESDTSNINVLTPSHFITGDVLLSVPEGPPSFISNFKDRWNLVQNMKKGFYNSWRKDYLSSLQERKKWRSVTPNFRKDDIVLVLDDNSPQLWPIGRILELHPGKDGLVRVVTVKTEHSIIKRPITKIRLLPTYQD